jgi:protein gp37
MAADTKIEWTNHSFNAWWGCTKVSPACDHCYAETLARRVGYPDLWGVNAGRRTFGVKHWLEPFKWNREAKRTGVRAKVFCNSMADVFDNHPGVVAARRELWDLIRLTPSLDWLILTKRIGNVAKMLPADWGEGWPNVWLGISVCEQHEADRDIPKLLATPAAIRFLSCEPLLGRIDLSNFEAGRCTDCGGAGEVAACGPTTTFPEDDDGIERCDSCGGTGEWEENEGLDWVICGGESGAGARYMPLYQAEHLLEQCRIQQIPFFMKQLDQSTWKNFKDFDSFPESLRVREWPSGL